MAFDTKAPLAALVALVNSLASMQLAGKGVPESPSRQVTASVTVGGQRPFDKAAGLRAREQHYLIIFRYRLDGDEGAAEDAIADLIDQLEAALYADRKLGGTVESLEADFSAADDPRYVPVAGQEFREYPIVVTVRQQRTY